MKTNKLNQMIIAFMAVVMLFALTAAAFADNTANTDPNAAQTETPETQGEKSASCKHSRGKGSVKGNRHGRFNEDDFEDWFEDRIEKHGKHVDFSELPENPTDEEILEFFKKYFLGETTARMDTVNTTPDAAQTETPEAETAETAGGKHGRGKGSGKGHRHGQFDEEDFEDWFEDRIEKRGKHADFSELPENPTDEEILEFFRKNFMDEAAERENSADSTEAAADGEGSSGEENGSGSDSETPETPEADPQIVPTEEAPDEAGTTA